MRDYYAPEMEDPPEPYEGAFFDAFASTVCQHAGHQWTDAGGGFDICAACEAMRETTPPKEMGS